MESVKPIPAIVKFFTQQGESLRIRSELLFNKHYELETSCAVLVNRVMPDSFFGEDSATT